MEQGEFVHTAVIKVGSGVITNETGGLKLDNVDGITRQCQILMNNSVWPILVVSGAINTGRSILGINPVEDDSLGSFDSYTATELLPDVSDTLVIPEGQTPDGRRIAEQVLSIVGQTPLAEDFRGSFKRMGIVSGYIPLDPSIFEDTTEDRDGMMDLLDYLHKSVREPDSSVKTRLEKLQRLVRSDEEEVRNLLNALNRMREIGVIPIINENDATSTSQLLIDNDILGRYIAELVEADVFAVVTENADGLHNEKSEVVPLIHVNEHELYAHLPRRDKSRFGRGGFKTKYEQLCIAATGGIPGVVLGQSDLPDLFQIANLAGGNFDSLGFGTVFSTTELLDIN